MHQGRMTGEAAWCVAAEGLWGSCVQYAPRKIRRVAVEPAEHAAYHTTWLSCKQTTASDEPPVTHRWHSSNTMT
jgi:2-polyprenyl-6-methoxyphenol hydroxylase-like FAD-dependent oxidoreductase